MDKAPDDGFTEMIAAVDQGAKAMMVVAPAVAGLFRGLMKNGLSEGEAAKVAAAWVVNMGQNSRTE